MRRLFLKKTLAAALSCAVLLTGVPPAFAETKEAEVTASDGKLVSHSFEEDTVKYDWKTGPVFLEKVDEEKGQSLCLGATGANAKVQYNFGEAVSKDLINIRFDYRSDVKGAEFPLTYLLFFNSKFEIYNNANQPHLFETLFLRNTVDYTINSDAWKLTGNTVPIASEEWKSISMWMDLNARRMYYIIDGKLLGETGLADTMTEVCGMLFLYEAKEDAKTFIDNYSVREMSEIEALEAAKNGEAVPPELSQEVAVSVETGQLGNIYYTLGKQPMQLSLRNKTDKTQKIRIEYVLSNEGRTKAPEVQEFTLNPFEEKTETVELHGNRYGFFNMTTNVYGEDNSLITTLKPIRYSVVNAPPEGVHNKRLGTNIKIRPHNAKLDGMMSDFRLAERIGLNLFRVEVAMGQYDANHPAGQTGLVEEHQELFKFIKEKGITPTLTLGFGTPLDPNYNDVLNPYALALIKDPMVNAVTNQYALLNEPDLDFRGWPAERYVEILKSLYPAMKAADPNVFLWGPTTASRTGAWIRTFFEKGGGKYVDGIDVHGYSHKTTPEQGNLISSLQTLKEIMKENGCEDLPIYYSEYGWSSVGQDGYPDEYHQGYYNIRWLMLNDHYDFADQTAQYTFNNYGLNNEQEMRFGMVKALDDEIPYEAKPMYLHYGNYNALMIDAEYIDTTEISSNVSAYRYKLADGRDCVVTWSVNDMAQVSINLGADKIDVYDSYGNSQELYSIDGDFSLSLTEEPIYLVGKFDKVQKGTQRIRANKTTTSIVGGDCADVALEKTFDGDVEVLTDLPDNLEVESNKGFIGRSAKIIFRAKDRGEEHEKAVVIVKKNGKVIYRTELFTEYGDAVEIEAYSKPYDANQLNHWQAVFTIKSNTYSAVNSGVIKFSSPEVLKDKVKEVKVGQIQPGGTRTVKVNLPQSLNGQAFKLTADIEMDVGGTISINNDVASDVCLYATQKPTIDGVLEKGEWNKLARMKMTHKGISGEQYVTLLKEGVYGGAEDLSADLYTMWDEENFYMALNVTDDVNAYDEEGGIYWASDGIQLCMAPDQGDPAVMGFGLGMVGDKKVIELETTPNKLYAGPIKADMEVKRNEAEKLTTYEMCIPWASLYPEMGYKPRGDVPIVFSILINDNDGAGRHGYLEYGAGVGKGGKNSVMFRDIFMLGKKR